MIHWIALRLMAILATLIGVSIVCFALMRQVPGDPATALLGFEASNAMISALRAKLHADESWIVQYAAWLWTIGHGDLGRSLETGRPVADMIYGAIGPTSLLSVSALLTSLAFALPSGIFAAIHPRSTGERVLTLLGIIGQSMPAFWLAVLLILSLSLRLPLLPSSGYIAPSVSVLGCLDHLILPTLTLAAGLAAVNMRTTRLTMQRVLTADFMRTAKAKGLSRRTQIWRHAFGNAAIPIVTIVSLQFGQLLGGVVVAETVFDWPGIGKLAVEAVFARDYPVVQGVVLTSAGLFVFIHFATDLTYAMLDPRVRLP